MTEIIAPLTCDEARHLTDQVKADAAALWANLLRLYDGKAWKALGHSSWAAYYAVEFGASSSTAYRMLEAGRVLTELHPPTDEHGEWQQHSAGLQSPIGEPANEGVARELVPLLGHEGAVREAWKEAMQKHGPEPTAKQVRETVREHLNVPPPPDPEPEPGTRAAWDKQVRILASELELATFSPANALDDQWPHVEALWLQVSATRPSRTDAG